MHEEKFRVRLTYVEKAKEYVESSCWEEDVPEVAATKLLQLGAVILHDKRKRGPPVLHVTVENSAKAKRKEEDKKAKVHVESINLV